MKYFFEMLKVQTVFCTSRKRFYSKFLIVAVSNVLESRNISISTNNLTQFSSFDIENHEKFASWALKTQNEKHKITSDCNYVKVFRRPTATSTAHEIAQK